MRLIGITNGKAKKLRFEGLVRELWSFEFISGSRSKGELVTRNTNRTLISYRALTVLVLALT